MKGKSPETVGNYRSLADNHVIPHLGAARLKKLTADELDTWMDDRAEELSTRTLRLIHQILERAIRHAQARDKVRRNVASLILVPEGQEGRPSKAMTLDQAVRLLDHIGTGSEHRLAAYVVVSLLAGVRTEEARALRWSEVDLEEGTVAVYRSVRAKGDTKTRKSRRLLKLPTKAVEALREHRTRQAAERLQAGGKWQDHDLVFCREDGTPLDRWQVRREFAVITRAAGLGEEWAPRELRHSFVSILQRPRRPHRGHQRPGRPQRHNRHRVRLPARDPARAHHRRHGHEQDPQQEAGQNGLARHATTPENTNPGGSPSGSRRSKRGPGPRSETPSDLPMHWSGRPDLNRRPLDPQSSALPSWATSRCARRTHPPNPAGLHTLAQPGRPLCHGARQRVTSCRSAEPPETECIGRSPGRPSTQGSGEGVPGHPAASARVGAA